MKGAYANEMNIRDREIMKKIFKDTQESFSSGGDPN
jgi:Zn-dependent M16 (insulinase) family peptidase